jgi:serine/threonine-protein kinase
MGGLLAGEAEGAVLAGRYLVEDKIGTGGMGFVYRAIDVTTGTRVAVKILDHSKKNLPRSERSPRGSGARSNRMTPWAPDALDQRFAREIAAVKRLRSPHAVRLFDAGQLGDGTHFMVMEHLEGADLHQILMDQGSLPVERAVKLIIQACAAIGEAHSLGIVHRDLKPANLFVARLPGGGECLKVLDFGISKLPQSMMDQLELTCTGTVLGSPIYMAPEQMTSSRSVDGRSDIWALGIVLYQLLSGGFPFDADTLPELCARVLTDEPLALSAQMAVSPGLEAVVMRCLHRNPARRHARVEDLAAALAPFAGENVAPPTVIVHHHPTPTGVRPPPLVVPPPPPPRPAVFVEPAPDLGRRIRLTGAAIGFIAGIIYLAATWPG